MCTGFPVGILIALKWRLGNNNSTGIFFLIFFSSAKIVVRETRRKEGQTESMLVSYICWVKHNFFAMVLHLALFLVKYYLPDPNPGHAV